MKAEVSGTIVMYVMMGVVIMMVIGFGVQQLMSLSRDVEAINCVHFRQEFKERLIKARPLGTVDTAGVEVGCNTPRVCFIDVDSSVGANAPSGCTSLISPVICDSWDEGIKRNVFLMDEDDVFPMGSFYVQGLAPTGSPGGYLCLEVKNGMIFPEIRGKGRTVEVHSS